jgi:hypothetical protein
VLLGASLLWFGRYGFNAGSAPAANGLAALAFANTAVVTCAAVLAWLIVEQLRTGRPRTLGAASGAVAGLVAIIPACGFVDLWAAVAIGLVAGVICPLACSLKWRLRLDDSLDVVAIHLGGGLVGTLMVGLFATRAVNSTGLPADGLVYGGGFTQLGRRAIAVGAVGLYPFVVTLVIGYLITVTIGFRARPESEAGGLDLSEHAETGYELGLGTGSGRGEDTGPPPPWTGNGAGAGPAAGSPETLGGLVRAERGVPGTAADVEPGRGEVPPHRGRRLHVGEPVLHAPHEVPDPVRDRRQRDDRGEHAVPPERSGGGGEHAVALRRRQERPRQR